MPAPEAPIDLGLGPMPFNATPMRPLLGLTVLVVEDSRFASEAMRLLCIRSGARIRRADSLGSAHRHLRVYSPTVVIIDLGLPDGSGLDLIEQLAKKTDESRPVLIATSGADGDGLAQAALEAGADDFLAKPIDGVGPFQELILRHLPAEMQPTGLRQVSDEKIVPDSLALAEDLIHLDDLLSSEEDILGYVTPFLQGLARLTRDEEMRQAAEKLKTACNARSGIPQAVQTVRDIIKVRVAVVEPV